MNKYQDLSMRTINKQLSSDEMTNHAILGMCSEIGEIAGLYQKVYQGHGLDLAHVKSELGDLMWFVAEMCTANGWGFR